MNYCRGGAIVTQTGSVVGLATLLILDVERIPAGVGLVVSVKST